ncbi:hypothetical protein Tco_0711225 [Tanacetum coccineum]
MSSSTITYTSVYSDSEPWRFQWVSDDELYVPKEAPQPLDPITRLSPSYVTDSDSSKEDLEEDPEEDPAEYPVDGGDDDDDDDDKEEASEEDEEEEEHLALADSTTLPVVVPVPSTEDTEAFETDKSAPTPPVPSPRLCKTRISIRPQTPMAASAEALIAEYASAPTPPSPPSSPLTPLSSLLPRIPSPPLPLPSPPTHTSPIYNEAPLGYRAAMIQDDLLKADMSIRKRARFTAPTDDSIHASESRAMTVVGEVNERVTDLATTQRQETHELQAADARWALAYSKSKSQAMESQIRNLQRDVDVIQRHRIRDEDRLTSHI